jgi:hypothetical protein
LRRADLLTTLSLAAVLLTAATVPARAGVHSLSVWAGSFDVLSSGSSTELGMELRFDPPTPSMQGERPFPWSLRPAVGVMGTSEDAVYGHAGFRLDLPLAGRLGRITVTPQVAAGYYERGDDKNLGGSFHFRSGLEVSARLGRRQSLGLLFYHLSNAGIEDRNPGTESLVVTWSVAF